MKVYFDTTVLVASAVEDHPHFPRASAALRSAKDKRIDACFGAHALAETYAVLTRAPFIPPIHPRDAWQIITVNILPHFRILTLSAKEYTDTIHGCAKDGWVGGRIYDALHVRTAQKSACDQIYTLNIRHFRELAPEWTDRIRVP